MRARLLVVSLGLVVSFGILLTGCSNPWPMCDGPQPLCHDTCSSPPYDCVGEPYEASCIDEDGDVHWSCWGGRMAEGCDEIVTMCVPEERDSGVPPGSDAGDG